MADGGIRIGLRKRPLTDKEAAAGDFDVVSRGASLQNLDLSRGSTLDRSTCSGGDGKRMSDDKEKGQQDKTLDEQPKEGLEHLGFPFDFVFDETAGADEVFHNAVKPLLDFVVDGNSSVDSTTQFPSGLLLSGGLRIPRRGSAARARDCGAADVVPPRMGREEDESDGSPRQLLQNTRVVPHHPPTHHANEQR